MGHVRRLKGIQLIAAGFLAGCAAAAPAAAFEKPPSILIITVDALRADHLGCYGYEKNTSPNIDQLMAGGLRFERAWTPEPLTGPAMCSMVTGLYPHEHGASRNGLRMQEGLNSLPKILARNGYATAAIVGTWTLRDNLTLLGEHFETYSERLRRRRWYGILNSESTCEDVTDDALDWLEQGGGKGGAMPFFLWVHYIEPHAPYRFHQEHAAQLRVNDDQLKKRDRYDTEIAAVDASIARLLAGVRKSVDESELLVVFTADHGESLGEHNYWGHGRYLFEPSLRVPLGIIWKGHIPPATVASGATLLDIAPTVLALAGVRASPDFPGTNWAPTARTGALVPEVVHCFQAHRGAVHGGTHDSDRKRSKGLLAIGILDGDRKEIMKLNPQGLELYDLVADAGELKNLATPHSQPSEKLLSCLAEVTDGFGNLDRLTTQKLDAETVEQLRALGYLE